MENRENVVADYFKLRVMLNRTNLQKNLKTDINFLIINVQPGQLQLIATLSGTTIPPNLVLASKNRDYGWTTSENTGLYFLEDFCANYLDKNMIIDINTAGGLKILADSLRRVLNGLGVAR